jgi:hypothetical protein
LQIIQSIVWMSFYRGILKLRAFLLSNSYRSDILVSIRC